MNDEVTPDVRLHPRKRPGRMCLFHIASGQAGCFTAEQARGCRFSRALLSDRVKIGRFLRIRRGLYRLREYPSSPRKDLLAAWLGLGKDITVVSHEGALDLLDLRACDYSDLPPGKTLAQGATILRHSHFWWPETN